MFRSRASVYECDVCGLDVHELEALAEQRITRELTDAGARALSGSGGSIANPALASISGKLADRVAVLVLLGLGELRVRDRGNRGAWPRCREPARRSSPCRMRSAIHRSCSASARPSSRSPSRAANTSRERSASASAAGTTMQPRAASLRGMSAARSRFDDFASSPSSSQGLTLGSAAAPRASWVALVAVVEWPWRGSRAARRPGTAGLSTSSRIPNSLIGPSVPSAPPSRAAPSRRSLHDQRRWPGPASWLRASVSATAAPRASSASAT